MAVPKVNDVVRLRKDIPELMLHRGEVGVVCSIWFDPAAAYEVEFNIAGLDFQPRALLMAEQVEIDENALYRGANDRPV